MNTTTIASDWQPLDLLLSTLDETTDCGTLADWLSAARFIAANDATADDNREEARRTVAALGLLDGLLRRDCGGIGLADFADDGRSLCCSGDWLDRCRDLAHDCGMVDDRSPLSSFIDWQAWADACAVDAYQVDVPTRWGFRTFYID